MKHLVFLLEEASAKRLLEGLVPRLLANAQLPQEELQLRFLTYDGKQDLEANLKKELRNWRVPSSGFVVMRDQDSDNCTTLKNKLRGLAEQSGKPDVLVRIACHELESWALGDWQAVAEAYSTPKLSKHDLDSLYADPDRLHNPVAELRKYVREYQKVDGARRLGKLLTPERNRSTSFRVFCDGVVRLANQLLAS